MTSSPEGRQEAAVAWPERLTLRDTKVFADEGQRIYTTATGYGYEKREYVRADLALIPAKPAVEVVEALKPFAKAAEQLDPECPNLKDTHGWTFQAIDFRRAARAYAALQAQATPDAQTEVEK